MFISHLWQPASFLVILHLQIFCTCKVPHGTCRLGGWSCFLLSLSQWKCHPYRRELEGWQTVSCFYNAELQLHPPAHEQGPPGLLKQLENIFSTFLKCKCLLNQLINQFVGDPSNLRVIIINTEKMNLQCHLYSTVSFMSKWKEALGWTQDTLKRLNISAALGGRERGKSGHICSYCRPQNPQVVKNTWAELYFLFNFFVFNFRVFLFVLWLCHKLIKKSKKPHNVPLLNG